MFKEYLLQIICKVLKLSAKRLILKFNPTVIAVTGSVGKSSTKEAIYEILNGLHNEEVRKNHGNLNSEIGLPLSILGFKKMPLTCLWPYILFIAVWRSILLKKYPQYLVLEMGVEKPGDVSYLCDIVKPDYIIITSLTPSHIAGFSSVEQYQKEKLSLTDYLKPSGKIIINVDDPVLAKMHLENMKSVGIKNNSADFRAEAIKISLYGMEYRIISAGCSISVKSKMLGLQMVYPTLFASAIASLSGASLLQTGRFLDNIKTLPGRMNLLEGRKNTLIIDDAYNANPASMRAALDFLAEINYPLRKIAILGNMNELGMLEKEAHLDIGNYAATRCDLAIFVGQNRINYSAGFKSDKLCLAYPDRFAVIEALDSIIKNGDLILVKASQNGNYFEEIVKALMKNPDQAPELLVRQSKAWMKKKSNVKNQISK